MKPRNLRALLTLGALAAPLLVATAASAQAYYPPPDHDRARFRGGVALEGGALVVPGVANLGMAGIHGILGAQINNQWGVYAMPSLDFPFGKVIGVGFGGAVLADFTLPGIPLGFGLGPEVGVVGAIST